MRLSIILSSIVSIALFAVGTYIFQFSTMSLVYGALIGFFLILLNGSMR